MRREEATKLRKQAKALINELRAGVPAQTEGERCDISWCLMWSEDHEPSIHFECERSWGQLTATELRRILEIKDALEAWKRNEGDWPLARTETK